MSNSWETYGLSLGGEGRELRCRPARDCSKVLQAVGEITGGHTADIIRRQGGDAGTHGLDVITSGGG